LNAVIKYSKNGIQADFATQCLPIINNMNWSEKVRNYKRIWSYVARLRISQGISEMTYETKMEH
ncbi:hypothetical protein T4B_15017, partial [Trichinella pseudospiralis]